jgi:iron uptake system component EfeO
MLRRTLVASALLLIPVLSACSSSAASVATVTVKAGSGTCDVAPASVPKGTITVSATYSGEGTGEVYLYAKDGDAFTKILGEVEDLTSAAKTFTAEVAPGTYEVKCEGGGQEKRVPLTVTG